MARKKITQDAIDKAKRSGKAMYLWDTELQGFGCRIGPTGKVSWLLQVWSGGKRFSDGGKARRVSFEADGIDAARSKAMAMKASDVDPVSAKQERKARQRQAMAATKLGDAFALYSQKKGDSSTHWQWTQSKFENVIIPKLGASTAIRDITKSDIISLIDKIEKDYPVSARYTFACLRPFFSWCVSRQYIPLSPMTGLESPAVPESRDRVLSADEIKVFWKATGQLGYPWLGFYRLLLLTGQRRDEVSGMRWTEIDTRTGTWVIPKERTKNGKEHIVHLSDQALIILAMLPNIDNDYVFTTTMITPISGYGRAKERLDKLMPTDKPWRIHDLRRTFVTLSHENDLAQPHVIEAAINHLTGVAKAGVAGTYNRAAYLKERRELFDSWGSYVSDLVEPRPAAMSTASNVLPFASTRQLGHS